jgi:multidrug efflux pump subunit AcrA (membrane-fusion protein)
MSSNTQQLTPTRDADRGARAVSPIRTDGTPRSQRPLDLRDELERLSERIADAAACRAALLDTVLGRLQVLGGAWLDVRPTVPAFVVDRLASPVLDQPGVREALLKQAAALRTEPHAHTQDVPAVRNLQMIAGAIREAGGITEVIVLLNPGSLTAAAAQLSLATQVLGAVWENRRLHAASRLSEERTQLAAAVLDLMSRVSRSESLAHAGQELARSVQQHLGVSLVAVGASRRAASLPRVIALSDGVEFDRHSTPLRRLEAALSESCLAAGLLQFPTAGRAESVQSLTHKRLADVLGQEAILSVPLVNADQRAAGSILVAGPAARVLNESTRNFLDAVAVPLGGVVAGVIHREGGPLSRMLRRASSLVRATRGIALGLGLAAAAAGLMIPVPYRISAACTTEPTTRRVSLAPFDGLLQTTHVAPGDIVTAGQLLASMDDREVRWELAGVVADRERAARERDSHRANHDVVRSYMADLECERLSARETLLRDRIDRLEVRSPIDGIVLAGSLDRRENVPVTTGQALYEIAPLDRLRIEVAVPADEISRVRVDMPADIRMAGTGETAHAGRIARIRPSSEIREGRNVFVAEVELDNRSGALRPGMEGSVRITTDSHPLAWNLFHRPWEYLLTHRL